MATAASFPLAIPVPVPSSHWDGRLAADLFAPCGTPWLAVFDGLAWPYEVPNGGHALSLLAADGSVGYYAHGLPDRASGEVRAGDLIGYVSDSGNAEGRGCHLHFAVGVGQNIYPDGSGNTQPAAWLAGAAVPNAPPVVVVPPEPPVAAAPPEPPVAAAPPAAAPLEPAAPVVEVPAPTAVGALVAWAAVAVLVWLALD
jgi:murein DD-endopeptidase MepM/ murein hydrolase activator NlpD